MKLRQIVILILVMSSVVYGLAPSSQAQISLESNVSAELPEDLDLGFKDQWKKENIRVKEMLLERFLLEDLASSANSKESTRRWKKKTKGQKSEETKTEVGAQEVQEKRLELREYAVNQLSGSIYRAIVEVVDNGRDSYRSGKQEGTVWITHRELAGGEIELTVRDEGAGMSLEDIQTKLLLAGGSSNNDLVAESDQEKGNTGRFGCGFLSNLKFLYTIPQMRLDVVTYQAKTGKRETIHLYRKESKTRADGTASIYITGEEEKVSNKRVPSGTEVVYTFPKAAYDRSQCCQVLREYLRFKGGGRIYLDEKEINLNWKKTSLTDGIWYMVSTPQASERGSSITFLVNGTKIVTKQLADNPNILPRAIVLNLPRETSISIERATIKLEDPQVQLAVKEFLWNIIKVGDFETLSLCKDLIYIMDLEIEVQKRLEQTAKERHWTYCALNHKRKEGSRWKLGWGSSIPLHEDLIPEKYLCRRAELYAIYPDFRIYLGNLRDEKCKKWYQIHPKEGIIILDKKEFEGRRNHSREQQREYVKELCRAIEEQTADLQEGGTKSPQDPELKQKHTHQVQHSLMTTLWDDQEIEDDYATIETGFGRKVTAEVLEEHLNRIGEIRDIIKAVVNHNLFPRLKRY